MIGLAVGAAAGGIQFLLLSRFTARVTRGALDIGGALLGLLQFILPAGVLIAIALVKRDDLIWTAVGITSVLIIGALVKFLVKARGIGKRGGDEQK